MIVVKRKPFNFSAFMIVTSRSYRFPANEVSQNSWAIVHGKFQFGLKDEFC